MKKTKGKIYLLSIIGIIAMTFGILDFLSNYFENILVAKEMDKLIMVAENNMSNLKFYFESQLETMDFLFNKDGIDISEARKIAGQYSTNQEQISIEIVEESVSSKAYIAEWVYGDSDYILWINKPMNGYVAKMGITLSMVYNQFLRPVQMGENGYCAIKDKNGILLMHPTKSQIGLDSLSGRLQQYPDLDPNGTGTLVYNQYTKDKGCDIVTSYWWDRPEEGKVKKLISYASVYIDGHRFVGSNVMAYAEVVRPLKQLLLFLSILAFLIAGGFCLVVFFWQVEKNRKEKLELKLEYAEEFTRMNKKFETQEMQIQKYDKLQTLGVLTSSVAHEFNNLLTPALLYTELLKEEDLSEAQEEMLEHLHHSIISCGEFSNQLKDYAKQDVVDETLEELDLRKVLEGNLRFLKHLVPKRIALKVELTEELCLIDGNKRALNQILINLFNNSFQAIEGKGQISLSLIKEADYAIVRITDNGKGMDEATMEKLYTPFFTTKSEQEGTGLGLTVVKRLLRIHHGGIQCESEFGKGTIFTLYFPLKKLI